MQDIEGVVIVEPKKKPNKELNDSKKFFIDIEEFSKLKNLLDSKYAMIK